MQQLLLNQQWRLTRVPADHTAITTPEQLAASVLEAIPARVPGNVELDLLRAGQFPGLAASEDSDDLFRGENIRLVQQLEGDDWWYETHFNCPAAFNGKRMELVFEGVDCLAEYWLNGEKIGTSENMMIAHRFDVTGILDTEGENKLSIRLRSAIKEAAKKDYPASSISLPTNYEQLRIRKAPHSYGWDIMPRLLSAGLWREVSLRAYDNYEFREVYLFTRSIEEGHARLGVQFRVDGAVSMAYPLTLSIRGTCGDNEFTAKTTVRFSAGRWEFDVPEPKLWYPLGYGEANLYTIVLELRDGKTILARHAETFGIRTVELMRTETTTINEPGEFLFKVNGVPILAKGSNHVPADALHSRDQERYAEIVALYRDAGCNIVRCWGGNVYEDHAFFDLCDETGIMVWQDFAMACAFYPQDEEFLAVMREEAIAVVKKLRNHASILLWSGDNEVDQGIFAHGMDPAMNKITREVLPEVVFAYDPNRPYLPSSPYYAPEVTATRDESRMPEQHLWGPRDYYKSPFYTEHTAHFVSEIGYHGCPGRSSLEQFLEPDFVWPWEDNPQWIAHCTDAVGADGQYAYRVALMAKQIREMFGSIPETLDDFILASQISQAEAKKFFIEMTRLKKWRRTGVIWWNMIDGWPQFSDAVVDYYFNKKLAYHYIRRVQQPVCLMMTEPENWHCKLVAGNDSRTDAKGIYAVKDADSQQVLLQGEFQTRANENTVLGQIAVSHGEQRLFLIEWEVNGKQYGNHYLLGHPAFELAEYRRWLEKIAALPDRFRWDISLTSV